MTWLHCDGEDAPDKENIGSVKYWPWRGFPTYFFPYYVQLGYLQPVVMVQLENPTPGVLINIQCTVWSRGMRHDLERRIGSMHLEFLMDWKETSAVSSLQMKNSTWRFVNEEL